MLPTPVATELHSAWFPHLTDSGLARLIDLLESASPLLIHGAFSRVSALGCLATHAAWHHPRTTHLDDEAGIVWLTRVACLNPATSKVVQEWDAHGLADWQWRAALLAELRAERVRRHQARCHCRPISV